MNDCPLSDIAMWKLHHTSVDLLLRKPNIEGAQHLLSNANVTYEIVIDDLQEAISKENPPKEVIEQFQNRKGEYSISYSMPDILTRMVSQSSTQFKCPRIITPLIIKSVLVLSITY